MSSTLLRRTRDRKGKSKDATARAEGRSRRASSLRAFASTGKLALKEDGLDGRRPRDWWKYADSSPAGTDNGTAPRRRRGKKGSKPRSRPERADARAHHRELTERFGKNVARAVKESKMKVKDLQRREIDREREAELPEQVPLAAIGSRQWIGTALGYRRRRRHRGPRLTAEQKLALYKRKVALNKRERGKRHRAKRRENRRNKKLAASTTAAAPSTGESAAPSTSDKAVVVVVDGAAPAPAPGPVVE